MKWMETLQRFLAAHRGGSVPTTIETASGKRVVLKMRGTGNGLGSLVAEFIVNEVAARAGWNVPRPEPILIPKGFPWTFGTDEFDDILQRSFGVNLGIAFIEDAEPIHEVSTLDQETLEHIVALDLWFANYDRLPKSANLLRDREGTVWLVDHGSTCFLQPSIVGGSITLPRGHMLEGREKEFARAKHFQALAAHLEGALAAVPEDWKLDRAGTAAALRARLNRCLATA